MASKRDVSDEQNERNKKVLDRLLKDDGNKYCVDCGMRSPTWASVNLGVFMCMTCSGIHRSLGVHISQVRSTKLDTWLPRQVEFIQRMGNIRGNRYWEAQLPPGYRRPPGVAPNPELQKFIRNKYCDAMFVAKDVPAPTIDNYMSHPYVLEDGPAQPAQPATPVKAAPAVTIPLLVRQQQPAAAAVAAAPPANVDLLGMEPAPAAAQPAPAAAASEDPFGDFTAAPVVAAAPAPLPTAGPPAASDPFGDSAAFPSFAPAVAAPAAGAAVTSPTAAALPNAKPAPAKSFDPFATLVGEDLVSNMQQVSLQPSAPASAPNKPAAASAAKASAADILKLYDTPQAASSFDSFLGPTPADSGFATANGFGTASAFPVAPGAGFQQGAAAFQPAAFPAAQQYAQYSTPGVQQMPGMVQMPGAYGAAQLGQPQHHHQHHQHHHHHHQHDHQHHQHQHHQHQQQAHFVQQMYSTTPSQYSSPSAAAANAFSGLTW